MQYSTGQIERFQDLAAVLRNVERPVLLVEGIRALPEADREMVIAVGRMLAERLPDVAFRSGNADGTDTAFSEGVTAVAPDRMEYVVTHPGMGRKRRHPAARVVSLDQLPKSQEQCLDQYTISASPDTHRLVQTCRERDGAGPLAAKAKYLIRDTLKVMGAAELNLMPATAAVFYVNEDDPLSGGTGHTIRVCLQHRVPVVMQHVWRNWMKANTQRGEPHGT
jgi:hypothetical protein